MLSKYIRYVPNTLYFIYRENLGHMQINRPHFLKLKIKIPFHIITYTWFDIRHLLIYTSLFFFFVLFLSYSIMGTFVSCIISFWNEVEA